MCEGRVREGEDAPDNPWQLGRVIKVRKDGLMVVVNLGGKVLMQKVRFAVGDAPERAHRLIVLWASVASARRALCRRPLFGPCSAVRRRSACEWWTTTGRCGASWASSVLGPCATLRGARQRARSSRV